MEKDITNSKLFFLVTGGGSLIKREVFEKIGLFDESYFFYAYLQDKITKTIFYLVVIYSIFIQSIGVFSYTASFWDSYPTNIDIDTERLWDFVDNPIFRSIKTGPDLRGIKIISNILFKS